MHFVYLLDTNILSDLVRRPQGTVAEKIAEFGEEAVCTSIVVSIELRFGAQKSGSKKLQNQVETILSAMEILPLDVPADHHYADIRFSLEQAGNPIGPNDMLIAAHTRSLKLTLVTISRVSLFRVELTFLCTSPRSLNSLTAAGRTISSTNSPK